MSYCSNKAEGSVVQQEKVVRLLKSRKIVSVKPIKDESGSVFVRGTIKKSYGHMTRLATIKFISANLSPLPMSCWLMWSVLSCDLTSVIFGALWTDRQKGSGINLYRTATKVT